jgi:hypothetical protein
MSKALENTSKLASIGMAVLEYEHRRKLVREALTKWRKLRKDLDSETLDVSLSRGEYECAYKARKNARERMQRLILSYQKWLVTEIA